MHLSEATPFTLLRNHVISKREIRFIHMGGSIAMLLSTRNAARHAALPEGDYTKLRW
ncbi:MAG: hypothetical protein WCJ70_03245 [bacterium]